MSKVKYLLISFFSMVLVLLTAGAFPIVSSAKGPNDVPAGAYVNQTDKSIIISTDNYKLDGFDLPGYWISIQANNVTIKNCTFERITTEAGGKKGHNISNNLILYDHREDSGITITNDNCKITGNTFGMGLHAGVLMHTVSGCEISDNTFDGVTEQAVWMINCNKCTVKGNTVTRNAGGISIYASHCSQLKIDSNNVSDSAHYGMVINTDNGSTVSNNVIKNSACEAEVPGVHGDGILTDYSTGTIFSGNTVDGVRSAKADWGNGIIVGHECSNLTLKKNTVMNAGNHGIQVSYGAENILLDENTVTASGYVGVSISRGSTADMTNNKVYGNISNGIVYDGNEAYDGKNRVKGTLTGNEVYSNTAAGIYVSFGIVDINKNNCHNNVTEGIRIEQGSASNINSNILTDNGSPYGISLWQNSNTYISDNTIIKSAADMNGIGILVEGNSVSTINQNRIANYGSSGIFAATATQATVLNNQVGVDGTQGFKQYAYYLSNSNDVLGSHNHLSVEYITTTGVRGGTHRAGARSGAVVNGTLIEVLSNDSGIIEASFSAQPSTDNIVLFTVGPNENSICINAKPDFVLPGSGGSKPANREDIEAFVERFYTIILDRPSEPAGLQNWTDALVAGTRGGADVAEEFIHSQEYMLKNESDEVYINKLYQAFFNRQPDAAGKAAWMQSLAEGKDRDFILDGFLASEEYRDLCLSYGIKRESTRTFVKRFYTIVLGRSNDQITFAELDNWQNALDSGLYPGSEIAVQFIHSPEYELTPRTDDEYLEVLYKAFFNRDMDPQGYQLWSSQLTAGRPRDEVLHEFLISQEFCNLCAEYGIRPY